MWLLTGTGKEDTGRPGGAGKKTPGVPVKRHRGKVEFGLIGYRATCERVKAANSAMIQAVTKRVGPVAMSVPCVSRAPGSPCFCIDVTT